MDLFRELEKLLSPGRRIYAQVEKISGSANSARAWSGGQFLGDVGDVLALKSRAGQFVIAGHTTAITTGNGRGSIGRTSADFIHRHLPLERIGQSDNHHALM